MSEHTCPQCGAFFLEAVLSIDPVPIMDTDKMLQPLGGKDCVTGERIEVVHIDDCRRIELEKLELAREVSALKNDIARHVEIASQYATDALRYQWLRAYGRIIAADEPYVLLPLANGLENPICEEELDAAIDAAMQQATTSNRPTE